MDLYLNLLYIDPVRPAHSGKTCLQRTKTWRWEASHGFSPKNCGRNWAIYNLWSFDLSSICFFIWRPTMGILEIFGNEMLPAQDSLYGKRDGALTGIAVVYQERSNIYRKTALWRQGVVSDVCMLERAAMFKPEVQHVTLKRSTMCFKIFQSNVQKGPTFSEFQSSPSCCWTACPAGADPRKGQHAPFGARPDRRARAQAGNSPTCFSMEVWYLGGNLQYL